MSYRNGKHKVVTYTGQSRKPRPKKVKEVFPLPSAEEIEAALAEAAEKVARQPWVACSRWENRDRNVPANPWSGKA